MNINPVSISVETQAGNWIRGRRVFEGWLDDYCARTGMGRDEAIDECRANRIHDGGAVSLGSFDGYDVSVIAIDGGRWRYTVETPWGADEGLCDTHGRNDGAAVDRLRELDAAVRDMSHAEPISDEVPHQTDNNTTPDESTPDFGSQRPTEAPADAADAPEDELGALIAQRDAAVAELAEMPTRGRPSRRKRHLTDLVGKLDVRIAALDPSHAPNGAKGAPKASDAPARAKRRAPRLTRGTEETGWLNSRGEFDRKAYREHLDELCRPMDEALASMLRRVS